jgi:serine palmitoyltransferase
METEKQIAKFLGVEACIVYAQAFSTISSVIPAFSKRGDIIIADRAVNFAIQKGLQVSRSTVRWFNHNDMDDLERVLAQVAKEQKRKPLTRRFIVTEGLFENTGDSPDLPKIVELKNRFKYRLILDETHSFGVLGRTGRGLTEQQNVDVSNVEMMIGSLSHALCAGGGFCAGTLEVVEHQRISSSAYVFSAALPAMLSVSAAEALKLLEGNPEMIVDLREKTRVFRQQLERCEQIVITSAPENPRCLFHLKREIVEAKGIEDEERVLFDIVEECMGGSVMITRVKVVKDSSVTDFASGRRFGWEGYPMLMASVTIGHSKKDLEAGGSVIRKCVGKVLGRLKK